MTGDKCTHNMSFYAEMSEISSELSSTENVFRIPLMSHFFFRLHYQISATLNSLKASYFLNRRKDAYFSKEIDSLSSY